MACFFDFAPFAEFDAKADFGNDEGALLSRGIERYDEETAAGEKPLTMLVALWTELSLFDVDVDRVELFDADVGDVDEVFGDGAAMNGVVVLFGFGIAFPAMGARYEWVLRLSGSRSFFSLIVMTIFSRSSGVMCLSRPLLLLDPES